MTVEEYIRARCKRLWGDDWTRRLEDIEVEDIVSVLGFSRGDQMTAEDKCDIDAIITEEVVEW